MDDLILDVRGITKIFPGVTALDCVDFQVLKGEIHGLVGENGAGKSTLMNIIGGIIKPNYGTIHLSGNSIVIQNPIHAMKLGIGFVHQESNLLTNLTVMENIFLSNEKKNSRHSLDGEQMAQEIYRINSEYGYCLDPWAIVGDLNLAQQQCVEITRALLTIPRILILDEPTAALDKNEVAHLFEIISLLKNKGVSIIYITHRLDEVVLLADSVTILKDGKIVGKLLHHQISKKKMVEMMVGRVLEDIYPDRSDIKVGQELLSVSELNVKRHVHHVNFNVRAGEIVGIGGLEGQGQRKTLRAIFGDIPTIKSRVSLNGLLLDGMNVKNRIQNGVAYLTHDRRGEGLIFTMSLGKNCSLASLMRFRSLFGFIKRRQESAEIKLNIQRLNIKSIDENQEVGNLSGGNQQKVMLTRWLMTQPQVLLIDEPTKGVDVGARMSVYQIIDQLTRQGIAILLLTSDMMELIGLSDRVLVFYEGSISAELPRGQATEKSIMSAASGMEVED